MEITDTFHARDREEWRAWLDAHHDDRDEIWLVAYRKASDVPSVPYPDAVEEALCFGWIDSTRKKIDDDRWAQRYTPRRAGSPISQTNLERLARLLEAGRVIEPVADALQDVRPADYRIPADIETAIRQEPGAWKHWRSFPPAYRRIRAAYVDGARSRPEIFDKRLAHLVRKTAAGRQFGNGIERFY